MSSEMHYLVAGKPAITREAFDIALGRSLPKPHRLAFRAQRAQCSSYITELVGTLGQWILCTQFDEIDRPQRHAAAREATLIGGTYRHRGLSAALFLPSPLVAAAGP